MPANFQFTRRLWLGLAFFQVLTILHLIYYISQPNQAKSTVFYGLALAIVGLAVGVIGFVLRMTPGLVDKVQHKARPWCWLFIAGATVILVIIGLELRIEWFYAQMALTVSATFALSYWTFYDGSAPISRPRLVLVGVAVLFVVATLVRIYGLAAYPSIHTTDEGWTLGWALSYLRTGQLSDLIMLNFTSSYNALPSFFAAMAVWLRIFGVGLWQARLFDFVMTLFVIGFTTLAARNWYGRNTALFTACALFCSAVLMSAARIRHDVGLALAVAASLWAFTEAVKRQRWWLHVLAGALIGWGLFAHYNALTLGGAIAISLYGPRYLARLRRGQRLPESGVWGYGLGALLAAISVFVIQIAPYLASFWGAVKPDVASSHGLMETLGSTVGYLLTIGHFSQVEFFLIMAGMAAALWRRRMADWSLIAVMILGHLALAANDLTSHYVFTYYYLIPLAPFYGLLVGSMLGEGIRKPSPPTPLPQGEGYQRVGSPLSWGMVIAALCLLTVLFTTTIEVPTEYVLRRGPIQPPPPVAAQWILSNVKPGATVVAEHHYFLWLTDYRFASPAIALYASPETHTKYPTREAIWDAVGVDVFVIDPGAGQYAEMEPLLQSGYFESRGYEVVAQFPQGSRTIEIYQRAGAANAWVRLVLTRLKAQS